MLAGTLNCSARLFDFRCNSDGNTLPIHNNSGWIATLKGYLIVIGERRWLCSWFSCFYICNCFTYVLLYHEMASRCLIIIDLWGQYEWHLQVPSKPVTCEVRKSNRKPAEPAKPAPLLRSLSGQWSSSIYMSKVVALLPWMGECFPTSPNWMPHPSGRENNRQRVTVCFCLWVWVGPLGNLCQKVCKHHLGSQAKLGANCDLLQEYLTNAYLLGRLGAYASFG